MVRHQPEAAAFRALLERAAQEAARLSAVVGRALELDRSAEEPARPAEPMPGDPRQRLTPRERQVYDLVSEGLSSKEIARSLGITRATARCHVQNVLTKLGVGSRAHAAALARRAADPADHGGHPAAAAHAGRLRNLTRREAEVLRALASGLEQREIAARLYLSPHTVRTHVQRVLGKLEVHSVLGALALVRDFGGLPSSDLPATHPAWGR